MIEFTQCEKHREKKLGEKPQKLWDLWEITEELPFSLPEGEKSGTEAFEDIMAEKSQGW